MDFSNNEPLSATTVVVDVDTMAEELKRLKESKTTGADGRQESPECPPFNSPPETGGESREVTPPYSPPPSQGGKAGSPAPTSQGGKADETPPYSPPTSQGGKLGSVYRPSWGGRFPPVSQPRFADDESELSAFHCGR